MKASVKPHQPISGWPRSDGISWRVRLALVILLIVAVGTIWVTNRMMTDRFTESTRNRAELRLLLYGGNLQSELSRNPLVPQVLARDPTLSGALNSSDAAGRGRAHGGGDGPQQAGLPASQRTLFRGCNSVKFHSLFGYSA